ncbi:MAG: type II toxin-antitoxin system RelE/ParE family toxin [Pseudomonadales bacterium]|nr:type II toxin-antitoxin system RelE/ParE family toxin [Pseudomonadales bacterium]
MINSFGDKRTQNLFHGKNNAEVRRIPANLQSVALRKLDMLQAAADLIDLKSPPGNRLEALKGDLKGFHSIRINDQWRIIFRWRTGRADDVKIIDYH